MKDRSRKTILQTSWRKCLFNIYDIINEYGKIRVDFTR